MKYQDYIYKPQALKNPKEWFSKAGIFRSTVLYLLRKHKEELVDGVAIDKVADLWGATSSTPYLTGLSLELYMKGYLIQKGLGVKKIESFSHDIKGLRRACLKFDSRWKNKALNFVCNKLGRFIMGEKGQKWSKGGVRYPQIRNLPIYISEFKEALDTVYLITKSKS